MPKGVKNAKDKDARILIVDDQDANVDLLVGILRKAGGYTNLKGVTDPTTVTSLWDEFHPDIILLDLHMPELDGFGVMKALKPLIPEGSFFPILVLTADITPEAKKKALAGGAADFLTKPFDPTEVLLRIRNLLAIRFLHLELQDYNQVLEAKVAERTSELEQSHREVLERLTLASEYRDDDTGEHTRRVGQVSALLARALGMPQDQVLLIRRAAPLHDVGKIAIPDRILLKPGPLTSEEFEVIKTHTTIGSKILSGGTDPLLLTAEEIALTHHERWSGTGYPRGLTGEEIPLSGRIVAVADVFDVLTHDRPYKQAWTVEDTVTELRRCAGAQFDPKLIDAFLELTADPLAQSVLRLPGKPRRKTG
jgi:putative two-component system response regulator